MATVVILVAFLLWVNFLPPLANLIWAERFNRSIDGGRLWLDGHPVFGKNKTFRGVLASVAGGTLLAPLLDVSWWIAATAAFTAMLGDLLTSFIKRRPNYPSGKTIAMFDQFLEGLFPCLFLDRYLGLDWWQMGMALVCFMPVAYAGSWFWNYVVYRPSQEKYSRVVRSTVRFREWRACHQPLARWQRWLNLTNFFSHRMVLEPLFKAAGLYDQGIRNALDIRVEERSFSFKTLPAAFDGFRILLLTDLHLDGLNQLTDRIIEMVRKLEVDLCLVGGDIRMETYGPIAPSLRQLHRLTARINARYGIWGVLGNHDCIEMVPDFEEAGILMLVNDAARIEKKGESLWLVGVDDPHYYKVHDVGLAFRKVPDGAFAVFLAHSPEACRDAARFGPALYLCGHTHGGQICLGDKKPLLTNSRAPRSTAKGEWRYNGMTGYTSRGAGASGIPLRFNCPAEITLITLQKEE